MTADVWADLGAKAIDNLRDEVAAWSPEENAGHEFGADYYVTDFLTVGDLRSVLKLIEAARRSSEGEGAMRDALSFLEELWLPEDAGLSDSDSHRLAQMRSRLPEVIDALSAALARQPVTPDRGEADQ